jgi:glycine oxidase
VARAPRPRWVFYNAEVKTWDVIIIGGGIIGLSLSIALRKRGAKVVVVERGEPGREASHAAGGMLVDCSLETPPALQPLAVAIARLYPEFAHEIEVESGMKVDLRDDGTILFWSAEHLGRLPVRDPQFRKSALSAADLEKLEPALRNDYFSDDQQLESFRQELF